MKNELVIKSSELVETIEERSIGDIIKPLVKEIHLFDTFVAGTSYIEDPSILDTLELDEKLTLQRESNKFDCNAVMILSKNHKIGYIPEKDNIIFSRLMDAGKLLIAKVHNIEKTGSFTKISIGIYLVDY